MPPGSLEHFHPFSLTHAIIIVCFAIITTVLCIAGRRLAAAGRERPLSLVLGCTGLAVVIAHQCYWLLPSNFTWSRSMPLHICDLAGFAAPLALLLPWRTPRVMLYFWGLVLSSQGLITPVLTEGPSRPIFWFFFVTHAVIIGSAIYDVAARGFEPTWRDWRLAVGITAAFIASMFLLNLATGWNYAYVGRGSTSQTTAVDFLGPWPWRVPLIALLGFIGFTAAMLPWALRNHLLRDQHGQGG